MNGNSKKHLSLSVKINLLLVCTILLISGSLVWLSYHEYSKSIDEHYLKQSENAAVSAKFQAIPEFVENFWNQINTEEFRNVRAEALAAGDEEIIINWMVTKPSGFENYLGSNFEVDRKGLEGNFDLWLDYQILVQSMEECENLFDITSAYIQHDENGVTYNLIDPGEDLFYIGTIEDDIDVFSGLEDNSYFPPTIYYSKFGWLCTTLMPIEPTKDGIIAGYVGVDIDMNDVLHRKQMFLVNSGIYILGLTGAAIVVSMFLLNRVAVNPLQKLAKAAADFASDDDELTEEDVIRLPINSQDEIGELYHQIRSMESRIIDYTDNLKRITIERERTGTELHMAKNIQRSMIPGDFPAFPDRSDFDLYASMTPAKAVGGDFYDFFMVDDDHLAVLIADVSDKGVPAALFMMSSKILINYRAQQGGTPAQILTDVNAQICRNNKSKMFVTVWMGILDLNTGVMICSNAGHEYPFIRGKDGSFQMLKDKHGLVVGALSKTKYTDYELVLDPGDAVFVYTDGAPEANDTDGKMYGMERLEGILNRAAGENPKFILEQVKADVERFVNGAKQFDDLTMLCVEYKGKQISLPADRDPEQERL